MSRQQFVNALARHGMKLGPFGYVEMFDGRFCVYRFNAGQRYRDQLAYLLEKQEEHEAELQKRTA